MADVLEVPLCRHCGALLDTREFDSVAQYIGFGRTIGVDNAIPIKCGTCGNKTTVARLISFHYRVIADDT